MHETVFAAQGLGNPIASVDQSSGLYYPNAQRFEATQPSSRAVVPILAKTATSPKMRYFP
jgi:hypothetical protein